jgi:hypothetical protein
MTTIALSSSLFLVACLLSINILQAQSSALPTSSNAPFAPSKVKSFIQNKCFNPFNPNAGIWSYEGHLVDPTNGRVIANVEGIELVRSLSEIDRSSNKEGDKNIWHMIRGLRRLEDLRIRTMLSSSQASSSNNWEYSGTVLSRKLFCYSPVDHSGKLLTEYKLHPTAPVRKVKTEEAVALYDTATSFVSRCKGKEMVVVTEFPDGRFIASVASSSGISDDVDQGVSPNKKSKLFDFNLYARRSGKEEPVLPPIVTKSKDGSVLGAVPPRSKFIHFGKDTNADDHRFGARESYSYQLGRSYLSKKERFLKTIQEKIENFCEEMGLYDIEYLSKLRSKSSSQTFDSTVRYTRYGEAPPWYGPGRMCTLELWGKRIDSLSDAPPLAAVLAATHVPGFLSVNTSIPTIDQTASKQKVNLHSKNLNKNELSEGDMSADEAAIRAVNWFKGREGSLPLQIAKESSEHPSLIAIMIDNGLSIAQKVRSATTMTSAAEASLEL